MHPPTLLVALLVAACSAPAASSGLADEPSVSSSIRSPIADPGAESSPSAPSLPAADPLVPTVIPGLVEVDAIDGAVVLGSNADYETVLYDLADGSTTVLDMGREARPGDLGGGVAVGALPGDDHELGSAFVYHIDSGALRTIELSHGIGVAPRVATDGHLVVGTRALTNGDMQAAWVYHLDSGRLDRLDFLEGRTRGGIADVSGSRMAGTFGADDDEKAWLYDIDTGVETPLHPLFGGALSWVNDIDGDLVVGGTQTPKPWTNQAIVYDVASGTVVNLASQLGGESKAWAVDGPIVVGESSSGAFVYDRRSGEVHLLPGVGWARAVSGDHVVGYADGAVVVWDIASLR